MEKSELIRQLRIERTPNVQPPGKSSTAALGGLVIILAIGCGIWFYWKAQAPIVKTAVATQGQAGAPSTAILDATGYVVARRQATVSAKITGKIKAVHIEEGQSVEAGAVLAELDEVDMKAQLALAQAQFQAARSQRADLLVQIAQAERDANRQQQLATRNLTSRQSAEQTRSTTESLKARLATQDRQISVTQESVRVAEVNVDNTVIRAPFTGVIVAKTAQPGEIVSPMSAGGGFTRTGIGTIVDMDSLEIEVNVNEAFIGRVRPQQPVNARLNAYPDWPIPAEVIAIIPTADRNKATVKVRIALGVKDSRIVPEMGVRVSFLDDQATLTTPVTPTVLVPASALSLVNGNIDIFVVSDDTLQRRRVKIANRTGELQEVIAGVRAGESVVVNPGPELKDGMKVRAESKQ